MLGGCVCACVRACVEGEGRGGDGVIQEGSLRGI